MTKRTARWLAGRELKNRPNERFYIVKLHGIEDTDCARRPLTADAPYDVIAERYMDVVFADISNDQREIRTHEVVE